MNDRIFDSMSAYKIANDIIAQTNRIIERNTSISEAVAKSTSFMREIESPVKYAKHVMPILNNSAWLKNDAMNLHSVAASIPMAYSRAIDYPKLLALPQWILNLRSIANSPVNDVFAAQKSWQIIMPTIPENSFIKNALDLASMFKSINETSNTMADVMKISQSITRFDLSVNHLYKFINGYDDGEDDFQMDFQSHLAVAFNNDINIAITEDKKIIIAHAFENTLNSLSKMSDDFTLGNEQKLFLIKLKSFYDQWKKEGMIYSSIVLLCFIFQPVIQHYHNEIFDLEDEKPTVVINKSKVENNYINESSIQIVTTTNKILKERPDNRCKVKLEIPAGTKINIVQDKGKWIKVKFVLDGAYCTGWTLNNNL